MRFGTFSILSMRGSSLNVSLVERAIGCKYLHYSPDKWQIYPTRPTYNTWHLAHTMFETLACFISMFWGSVCILKCWNMLPTSRVEQLVSEHVRVQRANASYMFHCNKSWKKSCRAKSCTSKSAWIIKKLKKWANYAYFTVEGFKNTPKKFLDHLRTHEHHLAHAWANVQWSMTEHYLPSSQILNAS